MKKTLFTKPLLVALFMILATPLQTKCTEDKAQQNTITLYVYLARDLIKRSIFVHAAQEIVSVEFEGKQEETIASLITQDLEYKIANTTSELSPFLNYKKELSKVADRLSALIGQLNNLPLDEHAAREVKTFESYLVHLEKAATLIERHPTYLTELAAQTGRGS